MTTLNSEEPVKRMPQSTDRVDRFDPEGGTSGLARKFVGGQVQALGSLR